MGKSILVMDTPECCAKCRMFSDVYTDMTCRGNGRTIDYPYPDNKIQDWCPLQNAPEKKDKNPYHNEHESGYVDGWNDCIHQILNGG